jgi:glycosyltransferase involved in cell wall biosynthesis
VSDLSKLIFCIDKAEAYRAEDIVCFRLEGWAALPGGEISRICVLGDELEELSFETAFLERPDVAGQFGGLDIQEKPGFKVNVKNIGEAAAKYRKIGLYAVCGDEKRLLAGFTAEDMASYIAGIDIKHDINDVLIVNERIVIYGWAADVKNKTAPEISLSDGDGSAISAQIERVPRFDVNKALAVAARDIPSAGFIIKAEKKAYPGQKIYVDICSGGLHVRHATDVSELYERFSPEKLTERFCGNKLLEKRFVKKYGRDAYEEYVKYLGSTYEYAPYMMWRILNGKNAEGLKGRGEHGFKHMPLMSIVVPLYDTPEKFLKELIDSVTAQSYKNFELILADGSTDGRTGETAVSLCGRDKRVKYKKLERNLGISENTNEAIKEAQGEYIVFADHDDTLEPDALLKLAELINDTDGRAELIYSAEDKLSADGRVCFEPVYKEKFNPDFLRCQNYMCHITAVKRQLLEKTGLLRREYDGAQDHDFLLRCIEHTNEVYYIPEVLYHWRLHSGSAAFDAYSGSMAKDYAYEAGKSAVRDHYKRLGMEADVEDTDITGIYHSKIKVKGEPKVSIIVCSSEDADAYDACISSIKETGYKNHEVITAHSRRELEGAVRKSTGEYLVFIDRPVTMLSDGWLEKMLGYCQREDTGVVGVKILNADDSIYHMGIRLSRQQLPEYCPAGFGPMDGSYHIVRDMYAVSSSCMMVKRSVFVRTGGFDERLPGLLGDADLCMAVRKQGMLVVFDPHVEARYVSMQECEILSEQDRYKGYFGYFAEKWAGELMQGDPYLTEKPEFSEFDFSYPEKFFTGENIEEGSLKSRIKRKAKKYKILRYPYKTLRFLKNNGVSATKQRIREKLDEKAYHIADVPDVQNNIWQGELRADEKRITDIAPCETPDGTLAVHLCVSDENILEEALSYINKIPYKYSLYISCGHGIKAGVVKKHAGALDNAVSPVVMKAKGSGTASMYAGYAKELQGYGYIIHLDFKREQAQETYRNSLMSLLGSADNIRRLFGMLGQEGAGLIFPQSAGTDFIRSCSCAGIEERTEKLSERLNVKAPDGFYSCPSDGVFIARASVVKKLFDLKMTDEECARGDGERAIDHMLPVCAKAEGLKSVSFDLEKGTVNFGKSLKAFRRYFEESAHSLALRAQNEYDVISFGVFDTLVILTQGGKKAVPRKDMVRLFNELLSSGKKVNVIADISAQPEETKQMLRQCGCAEGYGLLTAPDGPDGSFWSGYASKYENERCLHFGSGLQTGCVLPEKYGIRAFPVLSPQSLYELSDYCGGTESRDCGGELSGLYDLFISCGAFNSPFAYDAATGKVKQWYFDGTFRNEVEEAFSPGRFNAYAGKTLDFGGYKICFPESVPSYEDKEKNILVVLHEMLRTGAPLVTADMADKMRELGYNIIIMSPNDGPLREELVRRGYPVFIVPEIFRGIGEKCSREYEMIITDTVVGNVCLSVFSTVVLYNLVYRYDNTGNRIIWWIHESKLAFDIWGKNMPADVGGNVTVLCVCEYVRRLLPEYGLNYRSGILTYGAPDFARDVKKAQRKDDIIRFACVGAVEKRKGQDVLLNAIKLLPFKYLKRMEFSFAGKGWEMDVFQMLEAFANGYPNVFYLGEVPRQRIVELFASSDCVVAPSRDDPMPVVLTEGMIVSDICLCSTGVGTTDYIKDGENGFVFENEDPESLKEKLIYIADNIDRLEDIKRGSRKIYEDGFSMDVFGENVKKLLDEQLGSARRDI